MADSADIGRNFLAVRQPDFGDLRKAEFGFSASSSLLWCKPFFERI